MARFHSSASWLVLALAFGACAKSESINGGGGGAAGASGGAAGWATGGAAGSATGGAAGSGTGGAAGSVTGGAAGSGGAAGANSDGSVDSPSDAPVDVQPDAIVTLPGLQGFWRFEEASGPVFDVSGNGLHGTVVGSGVSRGLPAKVGNGIGFDGGDQKVQIPSSSKLDFSSAATIELWVKLSASTPGTILSRGTGTSDNHVRITTTQGNVNVSFGRSGMAPNQVITATQVLGNQWTHLAVVNDGQIRIYIDGKLNAQGAGGSLGSISAALYFGKTIATDTSINGSLDEVMWFDTARSAQDICSDAGGIWSIAEAGGTCT